MTKRIRLIANVSLIGIGLVFGVVFFLIDEKDLSLILFSIALASILYQFLGGIGDDSSFQLGAIKLGGASAVLMGFMLFFKQVVFIPSPDAAQLQVSDVNWLPISSETGRVKSIHISNGAQVLNFPSSDINSIEQRKTHEYKLSLKNASQYFVENAGVPTDTIGYLKRSSLADLGLFNQAYVASDELCVQVFSLYPERPSLDASSKLTDVMLPFDIEVFRNSRFSIEPYYSKCEVVKQTAYIVPSNNNSFYVVFLEQANSSDTIKANRYSKWLVKKFQLKLD